MKCVFIPIWSGTREKPVAYIGPTKNLRPAVRKHLTPTEKRHILMRQGSRCNNCGDRIRLHPYANCDADHIVGVGRGGRTTLENMQLLCVQDHRAKSAREAQEATKVVDITLESHDTSVYIFTDGPIQFPIDKRTPLEAISEGCGLSLLSFHKVNREWVEDVYPEVEANMFEKYAYKPSVVC